jgi:uncharacterized protein (TIGR00369 family)
VTAAPGPGFRARVAESFAAQPFMALLGARLLRVEAGRCAVEVPFRPDLTQQHGFLHAGVLATIADNACGYAALSLMPREAGVLTAEFKLNLVRPARGIAAVARAEVVKPGRTLLVARADVLVRAEDGTEELCAVMLATMMCVQGRPDVPAR